VSQGNERKGRGERNEKEQTRTLVDEAGDTLDTTTTSETANGGLGDTLDVVAKNLAVTLGTLSETLSDLTAALTGHSCEEWGREERRSRLTAGWSAVRRWMVL
jgi:hypothetical protein